MLNQTDEKWLRATHPGLAFADKVVQGDLRFSASYDRATNTFVLLGDPQAGILKGETLSGSFRVHIQERTDKSVSKLPALHIENVERTPKRHFNQQDKSACLCSPLEEQEFLEPDFCFPKYLQQLVIPFLYGQLYVTANNQWPWAEYEHGATGILEAYSKAKDQTSLDECLRQLRRDPSWPAIRAGLRQVPYMKGHTPCFCGKKDHIRRCHPAAWQGALRLQKDLISLGIVVS